MRSSTLPATVAVAMAIGSSNGQEINAKGGMIRRHRSQVAAREAQETTHVLQKRSFQGKATYYGINPGDQGACGDYLNPGEFTVALNQVQYGDLGQRSSFCGKTITITDGSKTTQARIVDACPTGVQCHFGALDMSTSLFTFFNDKSVGVFDITWWVSGGGGGGKSSSNDNNNSNNSSNNDKSDNNNSNDNSNSKSADDKAAERIAAAKKAKAEKDAEEAAQKKKDDAAKAKKEADAKAKAAKEAKAKEDAKIVAAQKSSLNQFSQIMQTLNEIVDNSLSGNNGDSSGSASKSASASASEAASTVTVSSTSTASA